MLVHTPQMVDTSSIEHPTDKFPTPACIDLIWFSLAKMLFNECPKLDKISEAENNWNVYQPRDTHSFSLEKVISQWICTSKGIFLPRFCNCTFNGFQSVSLLSSSLKIPFFAKTFDCWWARQSQYQVTSSTDKYIYPPTTILTCVIVVFEVNGNLLVCAPQVEEKLQWFTNRILRCFQSNH